MSDKKKKGKKESGSSGEKKGEGLPSPAQTIEYLEAKVLELTEKYNRL